MYLVSVSVWFLLQFGYRDVQEEDIESILQEAFDDGYREAYKIAFRFNELRARVLIVQELKYSNKSDKSVKDLVQKISDIYAKVPELIASMNDEGSLQQIKELVDLESLEQEAKELRLC